MYLAEESRILPQKYQEDTTWNFLCDLIVYALVTQNIMWLGDDRAQAQQAKAILTE